MCHFVNFSAYDTTQNSTFGEIQKTVFFFRNIENSKITDTKVRKMVHLVS